jgi:hypothetical protein
MINYLATINNMALTSKQGCICTLCVGWEWFLSDVFYRHAIQVMCARCAMSACHGCIRPFYLFVNNNNNNRLLVVSQSVVR